MMERNNRTGYGAMGARRGCGCGMTRGGDYRRDGRSDGDRNTANGCGCCGTGNNGSDSRLLRELQQVDFSLIDLVLYLDMYPDCKEAKQMYRTLQAKKETLMASLAQTGNPMTSQSVMGGHDDWIRGPWPWEYAANA